MTNEKLKEVGKTLETLSIMALSILESETCSVNDISRLADMLHEINMIGSDLIEGVVDEARLSCNWR